MDRVGGYLGYVALLEDARAYDDVLIALRAEAQARKLAAMEGQRGQ